MEFTAQELTSLGVLEPLKRKKLECQDLELGSFDVIIPTKNSERTIKQCLEALFSSDVPVNRVLLIDESSDFTPLIAEKMGCTVVKADANYCQALRLGASLCETPYFVILDSDILIHPKFYSRLRNNIKENFICKGTFYDQIAWKSLANYYLAQRQKKIGGLDAAFVNRAVFLKLSKDWDRGLIDAGGDTQLFCRCEEHNIPTHQDSDLVNLHLIGYHRRYLKQTYWYGKSARTNGLYPWTHFLRRFLRGFSLGFKFAFRERDIRYIPFMICEGGYYLLGWLKGK